jgi:hypothetical protein
MVHYIGVASGQADDRWYSYVADTLSYTALLFVSTNMHREAEEEAQNHQIAT